MTPGRQAEERGPGTPEVACGGADDGGGVVDTHVKGFPEPPRVGRDKACGPSWGLEEESGHVGAFDSALLLLRTVREQISGVFKLSSLWSFVMAANRKRTHSFYHHHFLTFQRRTFYCSKNKWPEMGWKRWKQAGIESEKLKKKFKDRAK